jgi:hypothetical protein
MEGRRARKPLRYRSGSLYLFYFYYFLDQNFLLSFNILFENKNSSKTIRVTWYLYKQWEFLLLFKRKKYKTVCAELAFAKSPSTEWSWFCIELIILFLYLLYAVGLLQYSKSVWTKVGTGDLANANSAQTVLYFFLLMLYKTFTCKIFWLCAGFLSQLS